VHIIVQFVLYSSFSFHAVHLLICVADSLFFCILSVCRCFCLSVWISVNIYLYLFTYLFMLNILCKHSSRRN